MLIFELLLVLFTIILAISIVWGTLKTGISPMFSSKKAKQAMLSGIPKSDHLCLTDSLHGPIIDLGSGWGTLVIAAARRHPERQVIGYELSWLPWLVSVLLKRFYRVDNLTLYRQDFHRAALNDAAILFCFLYPKGMDNLVKKLCQDNVTRVKIISNSFALNNTQPTNVIQLQDSYQTKIYVYHWLTSS